MEEGPGVITKPQNALKRYTKLYKSGEVFFFEGREGEEMYIIQSGSVSISKRVQNMDRQIATLKTGDFFGEMSLLLNEPRSATVKALEDTIVLIINKETFKLMIRENAQIAVKMIEGLAERIKATDNRIKEVLEDRIFISLLTVIENSAFYGERTPQGKFRLAETMEDLARIVGLPIIKVDEVLKKLQKSGLISSMQNVIYLEDWKTFMEFKKTYIMKYKF